MRVTILFLGAILFAPTHVSASQNCNATDTQEQQVATREMQKNNLQPMKDLQENDLTCFLEWGAIFERNPDDPESVKNRKLSYLLASESADILSEIEYRLDNPKKAAAYVEFKVKLLELSK